MDLSSFIKLREKKRQVKNEEEEKEEEEEKTLPVYANIRSTKQEELLKAKVT